MLNKWSRKYLLLAKSLADTNDACYSRKIGAVLVSPENSVLNVSYNGSCRGFPHNDKEEWLTFLWFYLLNSEERNKIGSLIDLRQVCEDKKICPRRYLNIPSGERMELCASCSHSETNLVFNCAREGIKTLGASIYCWCGLPCLTCTHAIIQSGIKKIICLKWEKDYCPTSRYLLKQTNIQIEEINKEEIK